MKPQTNPFYLSEAWRNTRNAYFASKHGLCERCGEPGEIVHHRTYITPTNINNLDITLDWANLELLCRDCHGKEHTRKQQARYSFGDDGCILPPMRGHGTTARKPDNAI